MGVHLLGSLSIATDVGIGMAGFLLGVAGTASVFLLTRTKAVAPSNDDRIACKPHDNHAARTTMAAQQLRDLAQNVASDCGEHHSIISAISAELGGCDGSSHEHRATIQAAAVKLIAANERIQSRLAEAELKIQSQAAELHVQHEEARTDALTRLANRRAFDAHLAENLDRFHENDRPFSLLMVDVDHFKRLNDTHGHLAGDEVLRVFAETLRRAIKTTDIACRYGGEEFAVIMPGCSIMGAQLAADRIRKSIESASAVFEGIPLRVTASIGAAECLRGEKALELVRRADDGVYASKRAGRNRAHWHNGKQCLPVMDAAQIAAAAGAKGTTPEEAPSPTPPTKFLSQDVFEDILERRILESRRTGAALSVLHLSIRKYDEVRKAHGDGVGALLQKAVGDAIGATVRGMDLLGQFHGGQFVAMLPGSSESAAKIVGRRVLANVASCNLMVGHKPLRVRPTLGIAAVGPGETAAELIERASQALIGEPANQDFSRSI